MVLIAGDFTYLYALWDTFFIYFATVVLAYGCGLAHGIIGILLTQYFRKKVERPTSSSPTGNAQANATTPDNDLGAQQPTSPPMPFAESTVRLPQTIPTDISVGCGERTYRYHNAKQPCQIHQEYGKAHKTKWYTPCKVCFPEFYSR